MGSREIKGESVISRKGKVIAMKQNKLFKKLWVFMIVLSFLATQFATVQAAAKTNKETIGYDWELLCEAPFFIQKYHRKEQKTMMKAMEKRQEARKNQEKTLKRMMAYQKKAEQMVLSLIHI